MTMCRDSNFSIQPSSQKKRTVKNGKPTNKLVFSAHLGGNDEIFPHIMDLYVEPGSLVADVTYGHGVFWRNVPEDKYDLLATDIATGVDSRNLPYEDNEIDCVVFDPPYMHTPGGSAHVSHQQFENYYKNNKSGNNTKKKYHEAVVDLYKKSSKEAFRVLRINGVYIVKCQDEVCSNRQNLTHVEIINKCEKMGFITEDLFVVIRNNKPGVSRTVRQVHARKNHSYFLVFWKSGKPGQIWKRYEK